MTDTLNIVDWIGHWAKETPDKTALHFEGDAWSYVQFARKVVDYANQLQHEFTVQKGDRVVYIGLNSADFLFLLFACARIGAIIVPLNYRLARPELEVQILDATPTLIIAGQSFQEPWTNLPGKLPTRLATMNAGRADGWDYFLQKPPTTQSDRLVDATTEPVMLVYTSGTTGNSKGVLLSHQAVLANAANSVEMHQLEADDHALISLPFFHVGGLNILTTPIFYVGGTITLHQKFDPSTLLADVVACGATRAPIVSAQMPPILALPEWPAARFPNLRSVTTGASPVPAAIYTSWQDKGVEVLQVYGATETAPIALATSLRQEVPNIRTTGKAAAACSVKIVDDDRLPVKQGQSGEILIKGENLMSGYWNNDDATNAVLHDGWYASGDIGYQDEAGFYYIVDRKNDLIISGGENIYPAEIESLLMEVDAVAEVAVVARQDEQWGEIPIALVRLNKEQTISAIDLLKSLDGKLARYKIPHTVIFVTDFPRNSLGKIQKFELRNNLFIDN